VIRARFDPVLKGGRLEYHATSNPGSLPCNLRLVFESAEPAANHYSLHLETSWAHTPPEYHDYHRNSSAGWFALWCCDLTVSQPAPPEVSPTPEYRARVEQSLKAEAPLADVAAMQREILTALRDGATFSTAHKEGGTRIGHAGGTFFRTDFGESPDHRTFPDEASFLAFLRQFYHWEIARSVPSDQLSEETVWRLILRLLNPL
jgi:hypothetical protein